MTKQYIKYAFLCGLALVSNGSLYAADKQEVLIGVWLTPTEEVNEEEQQRSRFVDRFRENGLYISEWLQIDDKNRTTHIELVEGSWRLVGDVLHTELKYSEDSDEIESFDYKVIELTEDSFTLEIEGVRSTSVKVYKDYCLKGPEEYEVVDGGMCFPDYFKDLKAQCNQELADKLLEEMATNSNAADDLGFLSDSKDQLAALSSDDAMGKDGENYWVQCALLTSKFNENKYKSDWSSDYYGIYKSGLSQMAVDHIMEPMTTEQIIKRYSRKIPDAQLMKEIVIESSDVEGEFIATIHLSEPEGGYFKEIITMSGRGRCQETNVNWLGKYCS